MDAELKKDMEEADKFRSKRYNENKKKRNHEYKVKTYRYDECRKWFDKVWKFESSCTGRPQ